MNTDRLNELKQLVLDGLHLDRCQPYEPDYFPRIDEQDEADLLALIDKNTPKRVARTQLKLWRLNAGEECKCPSCGVILTVLPSFKKHGLFCQDCGQQLDWRETW